MLVFANGGKPVFSAEDAPARVMLLGGASLGPRHIWWNLVSSRRDGSSRQRRTGNPDGMALPPDDDHEFIPLPDEPPPPEEPTHPSDGYDRWSGRAL